MSIKKLLPLAVTAYAAYSYGKSSERNRLHTEIKKSALEIKETFSERDYWRSEVTKSAVEVVDKLTKSGLVLCTTESCTGGYIANAITSIPGAGRCFDSSKVTYSTESKFAELGVKQETVKKYSVYSREVVTEMAQGQLDSTQRCNLVIASTGVIGNRQPPGEEKPVVIGEVDFAIQKRGQLPTCFKETFSGDYDEKKEKAAVFILKKLSTVLDLPDTDSNTSSKLSF